MATEIQCPHCYTQKGFVGAERGDGKCNVCQGTGNPTVVDAAFDAFNILSSEGSKCYKCKGSGICQTCLGAGFIKIAPPDEPARRPPRSGGSIAGDFGPGSADGFSCVAWCIGLIAAAITVLFAVLTVIVTMPIWVGAIAVSVIAAYLYSTRRLKEIGALGFGDARLVQVQRKKRTKIKVAPEFLQTCIRWNPDLLIAGGSGVLYAFLLGGILTVYNSDRVGKAMFAIAAVVGAILAWKSGRKILELRISEAVLTARQIPANGPRNAAQAGFGLSCVAGCIILILIIAAITSGRDPTRAPGRQLATQTTSPIPTRTVPGNSPRVEARLPKPSANPPPQVQSSRQPSNIEQMTSPPAPMPTPDEQFRVFVNPAQNMPASATISSNDVSEFVSRIMQLEKTQQIGTILGNYAPRVKYFDNGTVDHAFISKDKSNYYSRWPVRSYEIIGNIHSTALGQNLWEIRVPTKFHVVNNRDEWIDGDVLQILTVDTSNRPWLITAEDGEVTRRDKGTGQMPAANSDGAAPSGSTQAIGGGAFQGKGRVYRIPDLKALAGKELANAWLYGEFAFERQSGNIAICRTAVTVLFVGKGTTKVNIEFQRGFSVSDRILRSMRDPQLPLTYMLRAGPNDPIRLLKVRHNRDGTLEAFARSPIRLDMQ